MTTNVIFSKIKLLVCMFGYMKKTYKHKPMTKKDKLIYRHKVQINI